MEISAGDIVKMDEDSLCENEICWIDHRSEEREVVEDISSRISIPLSSSWEENEFWIKLDSEKIKIPISLSMHDRFITISSLAELLKEKYRFWLLKDSVGDDTIGLFILPVKISNELEEQNLEWVEEKLVELKLGFDYFNGIDVPYVGNLDNNPNLEYSEKPQDESDQPKGSIVGYIKSRYHLFEYWKSMAELRSMSGTGSLGERILLALVKYWWFFLAWVLYVKLF